MGAACSGASSPLSGGRVLLNGTRLLKLFRSDVQGGGLHVESPRGFARL